MNFNHRLIAHRGWQNCYPENTLIAVKQAIAAGAKHVEIDIQLSADREPMIFHDATLQRLCGEDASIMQLSLAQLGAFTAHEPQRFGKRFLDTPISPLRELIPLIAQHPEVTLYVEIKSESLKHFGQETVLQAVLPHLQSISGHCYAISFDLPVLARARQAGWPLIAPVLTNLEQLDSDVMHQLRPDMIFCNHKLLQEDTLTTRFDYPAALYEVGDYDQAQLWLQRGAQLIETFCIGELIQAHSKASDG